MLERVDLRVRYGCNIGALISGICPLASNGHGPPQFAGFLFGWMSGLRVGAWVWMGACVHACEFAAQPFFVCHFFFLKPSPQENSLCHPHRGSGRHTATPTHPIKISTTSTHTKKNPNSWMRVWAGAGVCMCSGNTRKRRANGRHSAAPAIC